MTNEELVRQVLSALGGKENIRSVTSCQTRLRITVKEDAEINEDGLKQTDGVLGIVHDRPGYIEVVVGPGKSRKCADLCAEAGIPSVNSQKISTGHDWKTNKAAVTAHQKDNRVKNILKIYGEIFVPLIPGIITAGICAGITALLEALIPGWKTIPFLAILIPFLDLIHTAMLSYLNAWTGYRAVERFGGTAILGGMLGLITSLPEIDAISKAVGLYNEAQPLNAVLRQGRGGVLAVVLGALILTEVEKAVRKRMPDSLDVAFTPFLSLLITLIPYIFLIMPLCGFVSSGICWMIQQLCMSSSMIVRILAGYISAALFLPLVSMGMHHGLVAIYSVQLEQFGYVTLYPALAMAGAGQVGAALAISFKARKTGNQRLREVIRGALPAGILGIGEPLIYGVTLPMGKPFISAGLGAGFGGAFVMVTGVASTTWGPSGILALMIMTAGKGGAVHSVLCYATGLVISYVMGFVITNAMIRPEDIPEEIEF